PLAPYIAVEEASLSTEMEAISCTPRTDRSSSVDCTPSMTTNGAASFNVPVPRIVTSLPSSSPPGIPLPSITVNPATRPANISTTLDCGAFSISSTSTVAIALVTSERFCVPYPTTTTSSKDSILTLICTLTVLLSPSRISWDMYPTLENTKTSPFFALILYIPSASVKVPPMTPFRCTLIEGKG